MAYTPIPRDRHIATVIWWPAPATVATVTAEQTHAPRLAPAVDARLRAIDIANRYGLGGRDEITVVSADVQQRLA